MRKGIRFRLYPTERQKQWFAQCLGCTRLVYNKSLEAWNQTYQQTGTCSMKQITSLLTQWKADPELAFLKGVDSMALQQSQRDLQSAFQNFFAKQAKHPKFKAKYDGWQSYRTNCQGNSIRIENNKIKLPKVGWVKVRQSMPVGKIHHATIQRTPTHKNHKRSNAPLWGGVIDIK